MHQIKNICASGGTVYTAALEASAERIESSNLSSRTKHPLIGEQVYPRDLKSLLRNQCASSNLAGRTKSIYIIIKIVYNTIYGRSSRWLATATLLKSVEEKSLGRSFLPPSAKNMVDVAHWLRALACEAEDVGSIPIIYPINIPI